jgi:hypothetical protein
MIDKVISSPSRPRLIVIVEITVALSSKRTQSPAAGSMVIDAAIVGVWRGEGNRSEVTLPPAPPERIQFVPFHVATSPTATGVIAGTYLSAVPSPKRALGCAVLSDHTTGFAAVPAVPTAALAANRTPPSERKDLTAIMSHSQ